MQTSEVLHRAADHIQAYGHHKGDPFGGPDVTTAPACLIAAIHRGLDHLGDNPQGDGYEPVRDAMRSYLHLGVGVALVDWNDAPERTAAEVIEALRAAALIELAKETADLPDRVAGERGAR